ncbi:glycosyl transferase family 1 [Chania multitudinisentens RB-25]|uniref:Glycosyl transferase family 1 n=1 Tax=Chania multitudinisentens RB-25 TaxID=1441930 RepID=W0LIC3_9GAMM|nr:glycosyltransferase family 4 protein [Chania multitudinisentens]AHG22102.1 glycosyl transferase family 1 [Chania multitudinisentens RB-25]
MSPRKIAIVIENLAGKGGTERVASGLASALARLPEYEVTLFSISGEQAFFPLDAAVALRFMTGRRGCWPWRLALALRQGGFHAIIPVSMGRLSVVITPYLRLLCPHSRLLLSEHVSFHQYPRLMKWLKLAVYRLSDRVIFLTRQDRDAIACWVPPHKCLVIENVSPFLRQPPQIGQQQNLALAIGRLSYQKGFDRLIAAWQQIAHQAPGWQLAIIGDGPERSALQRQIEQAGLQMSIQLLPATADVAAWYRRAGLFLMTSRYEGLPMVLIEAMSFGLPLVAYNCQTGPAELIDDGVNGCLVADGDQAQFCRRTLELIAAPELRQHYACASLRKAGRFTPERIYPQWQQIIT